MLAGYNRVFPDLSAANKSAAWYRLQGHDSLATVHGLSADMAATRLSDYPVMFHLARINLAGRRVFDLGGTAGDLFYLYDRYLEFPCDLTWTVYDLPRHMQRGRETAQARGEARVQFADDPSSATGADVLLISGALHYFPFTLADYLADLSDPPQHIFVNRTPLVDAPTAATVQYWGREMVACKLLNRAELVTGLKKLGYQIVDYWRVPGKSIKMPYDPEYWVKEYSGAYFRLDE